MGELFFCKKNSMQKVWVMTSPNENPCLEHEWRTTGSVCLTSETSSSVLGEYSEGKHWGAAAEGRYLA